MAQKIEIVRGTTNTMQILVYDADGRPYNLASNEKVVFGIKKNPEDAVPLFQITAEIVGDGVFNVVLSPTHTENLDAGRYWYDVGLQRGEDFFNVIEPNPFIIQANITARGES
jgi:hypothetical protein